jgi:hypothetical protein
MTDEQVEVDRSDNAMSAVARVKRQKDGPTGAFIEFNLIQVKIPELAGNELDSSLVVEITDSSNKNNPLKLLGDRKKLESYALAIGKGNTLTVYALCQKLKEPANSFYKNKIAKLLPMKTEVEVKINGTAYCLERTATSGFGLVTCK